MAPLVRSLSGNPLSSDWPQILLSEVEIHNQYSLLKTIKENPSSLPKSKTHIETFSFELSYHEKRLRFFAVSHRPVISDINYRKYEILKRKFNESPPQLVLIEGTTEFDYPFTEKEALEHGEQTFMCYLVQQHNKNLKEGETPIIIESGDLEVNREPNDQIRDTFIIKNAVTKFKQFDKIDRTFGSGHAIRQKKAWEEYFS
jgi:hypothetical protein